MSYPFVKTDAGRSESSRQKQKNDCTVRALAITTGMSYDDAYDLLKNHGRQSGRSMEGFRKFTESVEPNLTRLVWKPFPAVKGQRRMNPVEFCQQFTSGSYILSMAKHVTAVIDGVLYDDDMVGEERCVYGCWKVEDAFFAERVVKKAKARKPKKKKRKVAAPKTKKPPQPKIIRATDEEKKEYAKSNPVYPLYGWVIYDERKLVIEDLRGHWTRDDPQYEVMAPKGEMFFPDYTHSLLCFTLADLKNRMMSNEIVFDEEDE